MAKGRGAGRLPESGARREWVGGRLAAPMYITEGEPYRPDIILWLELPEGLIVGSAIVHPAESRAAFGESLRAAMQRPMIGPPRRPDRIRVAAPSLADDVRVALGEGISLSVAPTPELDSVLREMAQAGAVEGEEPESYLEGGRVSPRAVEDLFRAAHLLFEIAPWKVADDDQVLRVDIPQLGVDGACLSIIGALGESFGIILFPSFAGYEAFVAAGPAAGAEGAIDLGTALLSLSFERGADIPPVMRREVAEHGWPVAGAHAYPRVALRERDGLLRPLTENDVRIVTACAASLSAFFVKHRELFGRDSFIPVCESYSDRNDLAVRFTVPYDAAALFEIKEPPPRASISRARVGRNDPCPCGSGKKYKKCHLGAEPTGAMGEERIETTHERDARLVASIFDWANRRFGVGWANPPRDAEDEALAAQLLAPWCAYHASIGGRRVAELFGDARGPALSVEDRAWLSSQCDAWLSIWEVAEVEPGAEVRVVDLLTGETRSVRELSGSKTLVKRDAMLARIVDYSGISLFCGTHPRPLPPWDAAEVVRRVRARLRRQRAIPVERLRDEAVGQFMISRWREAVAALDRRSHIPPRLQNTDGDELLLTKDHFELDPQGRGEAEARLAALEGIALSEQTENEHRYEFVRASNAMHADWERTIIGLVRVRDVELVLETNSVARADHLRRRIEGACGGLVRHRLREHSDPRSMLARSRVPGDVPAPGDTPEAALIEREFKKRHYQRWPDAPLPALDGLTPREAVRTRPGRHRVDVLLKDMENHEGRLPAQHRFDFARLRHDLGLDA